LHQIAYLQNKIKHALKQFVSALCNKILNKKKMYQNQRFRHWKKYL